MLILTFWRMTQVSWLLLKFQIFLDGLFYPALNEKAASSQLAEQQFTSEKVQAEKPHDLEYERASATMASAFASLLADEETSLVAQTRPTVKLDAKPDSQEVPHCKIKTECLKCLDAVLNKLSWSSLAIKSELDPNVVAAHLKVISNCTEAISGLQKLIW